MLQLRLLRIFLSNQIPPWFLLLPPPPAPAAPSPSIFYMPISMPPAFPPPPSYIQPPPPLLPPTTPAPGQAAVPPLSPVPLVLGAQPVTPPPTRRRSALSSFLPSSPITPDYAIDPLLLLQEFLAWYKNQAPSLAAAIDAAGVILEERQEDIEGVGKMTNEEWVDMGVAIGLGKRLRGSVKRFLRSRS